MAIRAITHRETSQTGLISVLAQDVCEDEMTLAELLGHGSSSIGTFNGLGGEMIILGGICCQLRDDRSVNMPKLMECIPYAAMIDFVPSLSHSLTGPMTREEFSRVIDASILSSNYMYALWVTGRFAWTSARTVTKQDRLCRPMIEATDGEEVTRHEDFSGTIAGFRIPLHESGISVAGYHAHTIDDDRTWGGHLADSALEEGEAELYLGTDSHMYLPLTEEFRTADLSENMTREIRRAECH